MLGHAWLVCAAGTVTGCPTDIIFLIDMSASINPYRFNAFKSMTVDIVRSLPVAENEMHIGLVTYSSMAEAVFQLTDSYDTDEIASMIWGAGYNGGTGCAANGLAAVVDMFTSSGTTGNPRVVVTFTDGPDPIAASEASQIATAMKLTADMYAVRKYAIIISEVT